MHITLMKKIRRWLLLLFAAGFIGAHAEQAAAREDAFLELGFDKAADYTAVYPTLAFPSTTQEVVAVIRLATGERYSTMTAAWIAVEIPGRQAGSVLNSIKMVMQGKDRAVMRLKHPQGLMVGKYRMEITANGKPWKSAEFRVAPVAAPAVGGPADLLPLAPGTVWRYALTQEFGRNMRPQLPPGVKLDADGRFRAGTSVTVVKTDALGAHVETRQNNQLANEEWLRLTDAGLVIVKVRSDGEENTFTPPHILWPWPFKAPQEWLYEPADKSFRQRFRMWGPVSIAGPAGAGPGYVVLMEQSAPEGTISVERYYRPGIGLVREAITQARNGVLLTRTVTVLTAMPSRTP